MIEVQKHIKDLLLIHDCVIIPDFGGFVVNRIQSGHNEVTGVFTPPRREIIFNHKLSHNDGLLYSHVAQLNNISYKEAQQDTRLIVKEWHSIIAKGQVILLPELGSLKLDNNSKLLFTQASDVSIDPDMFGLSTFHFKTLDQVNQIEKPNRQLVQRTVQSKGLRQIAASVALVLGLLAISPDVNNTRQSAGLSDFTIKSEPVSNEESVGETIASFVQEDVIESIDVPQEVIVEKYFLIAGSFKRTSQAESFLNKLNQRNITSASILPISNGRFRVALDGFANKLDATEALNQYRKQNGFNSVWIYTAK